MRAVCSSSFSLIHLLVTFSGILRQSSFQCGGLRATECICERETSRAKKAPAFAVLWVLGDGRGEAAGRDLQGREWPWQSCAQAGPRELGRGLILPSLWIFSFHKLSRSISTSSPVIAMRRSSTADYCVRMHRVRGFGSNSLPSKTFVRRCIVLVISVRMSGFWWISKSWQIGIPKFSIISIGLIIWEDMI